MMNFRTLALAAPMVFSAAQPALAGSDQFKLFGMNDQRIGGAIPEECANLSGDYLGSCEVRRYDEDGSFTVSEINSFKLSVAQSGCSAFAYDGGSLITINAQSASSKSGPGGYKNFQQALYWIGPKKLELRETVSGYKYQSLGNFQEVKTIMTLQELPDYQVRYTSRVVDKKVPFGTYTLLDDVEKNCTLRKIFY